MHLELSTFLELNCNKIMEKEQPDSMATVQMNKADYAASDVYSTTSEPPPVS